MAKVSPVSIKYMIHANFLAEGALEKPDVIGALFGQTEGLLGSDLEMRELQKEGKIGRIEVELETRDKKTTGHISIPTALDQSETTLIAAAIETIERIGPSDAQIEVEKIEDVRGTKRDYIIERAKKLMSQIHGYSDSREISNTVKTSSRMAQIQEFGNEKLPCGNISGNEVIVVEGRADVLNLLRNGVNNVIAMNGTKLPESIRELSQEKQITLFVDGDRGGKLIIKNVLDNAKIDSIVVAPDGKEVEELTGKEILMALRKRIPASRFSFRENLHERGYDEKENNLDKSDKNEDENPIKKIKLMEEDKKKLKKLSDNNHGKGKAILLNVNLEEIKKVSTRNLINTLKEIREKIYVLIIDGTVTSGLIGFAEKAGCQAIVAKNFASVDTNMELLSL